jgi:PAS domain S-box-containing protein
VETRIREALRSVSAASVAFLETATDYDRLLDTVVQSISQVLDATCMISLRVEPRSIMPVAMHDADEGVRALFAEVIGQAFPLGEAQLVDGVMQSGTWFEPAVDVGTLEGRVHPAMLALWKQIGLDGLVIVPLRFRGEALGIVLVLRHRPSAGSARRPLDDLDRELAEHLATHAALALGNAKLHQEVRALESSRFVDTILEHIPDMVFVKDATELRFVRFNRAGEELLGITSEELLGKNDFDFFPPTEAEFFIRKDRETLASKTLVDIPEEPIETRNGRRWLHTKKVPIVDEQGTPRYLLGISADITERKRAMTELASTLAKLDESNRELEAFSYSVAHDLRAPLRAIDGFSQALLDDHASTLDATGKRHLDRIRAGAQRMAALIDDLLHLSRVSRAEHRPKPVDVSAIARAAIERLQRADPAREVEVAIEDGLRANADPKLLAIVFDNLFGNAWKFTAKVARPRVELGVLPDTRPVVYFVRDNGAGFDMAYQNKLFGVFQRLHAEHEFPGTGIGLATVKRIIARHGGRIWAEAGVGKGATFFFTLSEEPWAPA